MIRIFRKNCHPCIQVRVFARQVELALKYNMSLVLHVRDADAEALAILKHLGVPEDHPLHRHCFSGCLSDANTWISTYSECKLGFTGLVTYSNARHVQNVVKSIPLDKILLETDAPYMIPVGAKKNLKNCSFPGHIVRVANKVGELRGVRTHSILLANLENSRKIYRKYFI